MYFPTTALLTTLLLTIAAAKPTRVAPPAPYETTLQFLDLVFTLPLDNPYHNVTIPAPWVGKELGLGPPRPCGPGCRRNAAIYAPPSGGRIYASPSEAIDVTSFLFKANVTGLPADVTAAELQIIVTKEGRGYGGKGKKVVLPVTQLGVATYNVTKDAKPEGKWTSVGWSVQYSPKEGGKGSTKGVGFHVDNVVMKIWPSKN